MKNLTLMIGLILVAVILSGCAGLFKSTEDKQVNFDSQVYGFKLTAFDPTTGTTSPSGEFGFGSLNYRSIPIEKGQPFYASYTVKSIWSSAPASETIIWIGRAHDKSILEFEAIPIGMMVVSKIGITIGTGIPELKLTPINPIITPMLVPEKK